MSRMLHRLRLVLLVAPLLGGCAALQPTVAPTATASLERPYHQALDATGRLTLRFQREGGPEILHGSFEWHQQADRTQVTLYSPLGQAVARIAMGPQGASLLQAGQAAQSAPDVDQLLVQTLGWPLPVSGLREWLQGVALDAQGRRVLASPAQERILTADGWHLHYPSWAADASGQPRPRRIDLNRQTAQAGDIAIRIVIDTWQTR